MTRGCTENRAIPQDQHCVSSTLSITFAFSYDLEEGEKGALAKDLREKDPDRVARVTARLRYGARKTPHRRLRKMLAPSTRTAKSRR